MDGLSGVIEPRAVKGLDWKAWLQIRVHRDRDHVSAGKREGVDPSDIGRPRGCVVAVARHLIGRHAVIAKEHDLAARVHDDADLPRRRGTVDVESRQENAGPDGHQHLVDRWVEPAKKR